MSRSKILIFLAVMLVAIAVACDRPAEKPTAEPPTPVPTVTPEPRDESSSAGTTGRAGLFEDGVQECLAEELGLDVDSGTGGFDRGTLRSIDPEEVAEAFEVCGSEQAGRFSGGGLLSGATQIDPEVRECLAEQLGEGTFDDIGRGSGFGLGEGFSEAIEECGLDLDSITSGFQVGGDGGFGERGGFADLGSVRDCLTEALGPDALLSLRNPEGPPPPELQEALSQCGGGIAIPVEPDDGIGDGAGPIPVDPVVEPTATEIPVSELSIEQLTCLSGELEPSDLASAVVATSSGDLSELPDEVLAALQACDVVG